MSSETTSTTPSGDTSKGFLLALGAYVIWGVIPFYFRAMTGIPVDEVVVHRVIWSLPIALIVLFAMGRTQDLWAAFRSPRTLLMSGLAAALITVNWSTYIIAVQNDRTLDAALGYYINPLFSIFLGAVLLGEKLTPRKIFAIGLAAAAVIYLTVSFGQIPYVALTLTVSWGFYAYLKRSLPIGPNQGFALEVILLTPFVLAWWAYKFATGTAYGLGNGSTDLLLMIGSGVVTAVPLMLYANGAKGLTLTTIAVMQYLTPTFLFFFAIFLFREPFSMPQMIAFAMIWTALAIYSSTYFQKRKPDAQKA